MKFFLTFLKESDTILQTICPYSTSAPFFRANAYN